MNRDEFVKRYNDMVDRAVHFHEMDKKDGLLPLEDELHEIEKMKKDISETFSYKFLEKKQDNISENLRRKGINISEIDSEKLPILLRITLEFKISFMHNKILKFKIKDEKDLFEYGIYLATWGIDRSIINKKLDKIIDREKDRHLRILKSYAVDAVIFIQDGTNPKVLYDVLNYILLIYEIKQER
ncbi:MAG: hypothetical protein Ta2B_16930 [Termitinemataceae bacterium]|nr:MAG: hypothetical protein Ta2B_16930 [Termitinemataceae bacterium]